MSFVLGFLGTFLIILSQFALGYKQRYSFILAALGNAVWLYTSVIREPFQLDLMLTSLCFITLSVRNYILWGKKDAN